MKTTFFTIITFFLVNFLFSQSYVVDFGTTPLWDTAAGPFTNSSIIFSGIKDDPFTPSANSGFKMDTVNYSACCNSWNSNFDGAYFQPIFVKTIVDLSNIPFGNKIISFDIWQYNGQKYHTFPLDYVASNGSYTVSVDTNSLVEGSIVTITGDIDTIIIGNWANDLAIDNFKVIQTTTSITNINKDLKANVYPNPASNFVNVDIEELLNIVLININGKKLKSSTQKSFSVSEFPKGYYFLEITTKEGIINKPLIIE